MMMDRWQVENHMKSIEQKRTKKTNADRIRNMTDEELADSNIYFVSEFVMKEGLRYTGLDGHYYKTGKEVYEANIIWLKSEVGCE